AAPLHVPLNCPRCDAAGAGRRTRRVERGLPRRVQGLPGRRSRRRLQVLREEARLGEEGRPAGYRDLRSGLPRLARRGPAQAGERRLREGRDRGPEGFAEQRELSRDGRLDAGRRGPDRRGARGRRVHRRTDCRDDDYDPRTRTRCRGRPRGRRRLRRVGREPQRERDHRRRRAPAARAACRPRGHRAARRAALGARPVPRLRSPVAGGESPRDERGGLARVGVVGGVHRLGAPRAV
ncbi:MAG: hypothetical protein AVDCRST_MAG53-3419, partial [uncultured Solirubrobacteraceae bacterium]